MALVLFQPHAVLLEPPEYHVKVLQVLLFCGFSNQDVIEVADDML